MPDPIIPEALADASWPTILKTTREKALLEGIRLGLEAASHWLLSGWPDLPKRQELASAVRALSPETIAKEATRDE